MQLINNKLLWLFTGTVIGGTALLSKSKTGQRWALQLSAGNGDWEAINELLRHNQEGDQR